MPAMTAAQEAGWHALMELYGAVREGWTRGRHRWRLDGGRAQQVRNR